MENLIKKIVAPFFIIATLIACNNDEKVSSVQRDSLVKKATEDTSSYTTIQWLDTVLSFGSVKQGEKVLLKFKCKNTGVKPLVLTNVRPGCGCTVADYSKEAILPGKEGWVETSFDSKKFCGEVHKSVMAMSNTINDRERNLQFTGTITNCESNDKIVLPHPMPEDKKK